MNDSCGGEGEFGRIAETGGPIEREMRFRLAVRVFEVACIFWKSRWWTLVRMHGSDEIDLDHLSNWLVPSALIRMVNMVCGIEWKWSGGRMTEDEGVMWLKPLRIPLPLHDHRHLPPVADSRWPNPPHPTSGAAVDIDKRKTDFYSHGRHPADVPRLAAAADPSW